MNMLATPTFECTFSVCAIDFAQAVWATTHEKKLAGINVGLYGSSRGAPSAVAVTLLNAPANGDPFGLDFAVIDLQHAHRRRISRGAPIERVRSSREKALGLGSQRYSSHNLRVRE
jgi:hypothetical protein